MYVWLLILAIVSVALVVVDCVLYITGRHRHPAIVGAPVMLMGILATGLSTSPMETEGGMGSPLYPRVELKDLPRWVRPRAEVRGTVTYAKKEADGDFHFRVEDGMSNFAVCEIVPELPHPVPRVGQQVKVLGIVRYDGEHKWWELHPVVGWEGL